MLYLGVLCVHTDAHRSTTLTLSIDPKFLIPIYSLTAMNNVATLIGHFVTLIGHFATLIVRTSNSSSDRSC